MHRETPKKTIPAGTAMADRLTPDTVTYRFRSSSTAWAFMRACDAVGLPAGFPGLKLASVSVSIRTWMDREVADKLAGDAPCVGYEFGRVAS